MACFFWIPMPAGLFPFSSQGPGDPAGAHLSPGEDRGVFGVPGRLVWGMNGRVSALLPSPGQGVRTV